MLDPVTYTGGTPTPLPKHKWCSKVAFTTSPAALTLTKTTRAISVVSSVAFDLSGSGLAGTLHVPAGVTRDIDVRLLHDGTLGVVNITGSASGNLSMIEY